MIKIKNFLFNHFLIDQNQISFFPKIDYLQIHINQIKLLIIIINYQIMLKFSFPWHIYLMILYVLMEI